MAKVAKVSKHAQILAATFSGMAVSAVILFSVGRPF